MCMCCFLVLCLCPHRYMYDAPSHRVSQAHPLHTPPHPAWLSAASVHRLLASPLCCAGQPACLGECGGWVGCVEATTSSVHRVRQNNPEAMMPMWGKSTHRASPGACPAMWPWPLVPLTASKPPRRVPSALLYAGEWLRPLQDGGLPWTTCVAGVFDLWLSHHGVVGDAAAAVCAGSCWVPCLSPHRYPYVDPSHRWIHPHPLPIPLHKAWRNAAAASTGCWHAPGFLLVNAPFQVSGVGCVLPQTHHSRCA